MTAGGRTLPWVCSQEWAGYMTCRQACTWVGLRMRVGLRAAGPCASCGHNTAAGARSKARLPRGGALHAYALGATANRTRCGRDCAAVGPADVPASGKLTLPLLAGASCPRCDAACFNTMCRTVAAGCLLGLL